MEDSKRIYFLDTLRSFIIFLVIFYHVTIHYVAPFQLPMFIHNIFPQKYSSFFGIIFLITNGQTLNSILFFIAGYFALAPLIRKGTLYFVKNKLVHIGLPYLVGVILLTPLAQYIAYCSWGKRMNYFKYWFFEFFKPQHYVQYQFWFLGVLLFFFLILGLIFLIFKAKITALKITPGKHSPLFPIGFIIITTGLYYFVDRIYSATMFTNLYVLYFQTVMLLVYAAYFCLGIYASKQDWFKSGFKPKIFPWTISYIISLLIYLVTVIFTIKNQNSPNIEIIIMLMDLSLNVSIFSALFMSLALFQKYFNGYTPILQGISKSSYSTYFVHYLVVCILINLTRNIPQPLFLKYFSQIVTGTVISWGIGYALKKAPISRKVL